MFGFPRNAGTDDGYADETVDENAIDDRDVIDDDVVDDETTVFGGAFAPDDDAVEEEVIEDDDVTVDVDDDAVEDAPQNVAPVVPDGGPADISTKIRFQCISPDAVEPNRQHADDAGADLSTIEDFTLEPGERRLVRTGIVLEIPYGMLGYVVPRSGLAAKHGVTIVNAPGLIDSGYRGEVMVCLLNTGDEQLEFHKGDRIAQLVIQRHVSPLFYETSALTETKRGDNGFGSTGTGKR